MPNARYYTPDEIKNIFEYALTKIDFTEEGLTRDTNCTKGIEHCDDEYVKTVIQKITELEKDNFKKIHNSHDWVKILKHVFQNGQIINFKNINVFKEWREFSTYSRKAFEEKENIEKPKEYITELKKFMAKLIHHGCVKEVNCIHLMLHLAYKVFTEDKTKANTSEKVASMLGCIFYDALQLEGIVKSFTLLELDGFQTKEYILRTQQCSCFFKNVIEDPLFSEAFKKTDYAQYLVTPKLDTTEDNRPEKKYSRKQRALSLEMTKKLDPEFISAFKKMSIIQASRSDAELPRKYPEITFSYSNGPKIGAQFKEANIPLEITSEDATEEQKTKSKNRLSLSLFKK